MESEKAASHFTSFRDLRLEIRESEGRYRWTVSKINTSDETARGEAPDLPSAMVAAAEAAGADWGSVRWRGRDDDNEES